MLKKLIKRRILNNRFINPVLGFFGLDATLNDLSQDYIDYRPDKSRSLQEIAGYSNKPEIAQTLAAVKEKLSDTFLQTLALSGSEKPELLDIGCGPGLYLKTFTDKAHLTGIDISSAMCEIAKEQVPQAEIICGHFLKYGFQKKFDLIYSVGVLIYFSRSQVKQFFSKICSILKPGGLAFISYPHAFRASDLQYADYTYTHYSPSLLEKMISSEFEIIYHRHQNGKVKVTDYDREPLIIPENFDQRSYYNSSILIIKKK